MEENHRLSAQQKAKKTSVEQNAFATENRPAGQSSTIPIISSLSPLVHWVLFLSSFIGLAYYQLNKPTWVYGDVVIINGFTLLIWTTVLFFSAIVSSYSKKYLTGFRYQQRFTLLSIGFTLSVMLFVASNHLAASLIAWFAMGFFMSKLIGVNKSWGEAREAEKFSLRYFTAGSIILTLGLLSFSYINDEFTLRGLMYSLEMGSSRLFILSLFIITAAIIQSAIYPFHKWLLSAMTAPTPASALMHAGFVNGSGILLTLFAPVFVLTDSLWILLVIGGVTAIVAQFQKLIQVNVKHKLACSTIAQMGFMIMQCGLGFFNAAIAHLILHGFYKAYLFLSAGEQVQQSVPKKSPKIQITAIQALSVGVFGTLGALLFAFLTGKTSFTNSSIFLTLIVAITVGQAAYNLVKERNISYQTKIGATAALIIVGISTYALLFNGITLLMSEMPMVQVPQQLDALQIGFGIIFLVGFFIMKLGLHQKSPWLYVKLLNLSQPAKTTIHYFKK